MENFSIGNLIIGIIGVIAGIYIMKEAFFLNSKVLRLHFAERKFGPGTGTTAYTFIGLGIVIFSIFVAIGSVNISGNIGPRQVILEAPQKTYNPIGISE
jgi:hypothetical protein